MVRYEARHNIIAGWSLYDAVLDELVTSYRLTKNKAVQLAAIFNQRYGSADYRDMEKLYTTKAIQAHVDSIRESLDK